MSTDENNGSSSTLLLLVLIKGAISIIIYLGFIVTSSSLPCLWHTSRVMSCQRRGSDKPSDFKAEFMKFLTPRKHNYELGWIRYRTSVRGLQSRNGSLFK